MIRASIAFAAQRVLGSRAPSHYREFLRISKSSFSEVLALRDRRLARLLAHAAASIPYYACEVGKERSPRLHSFPVLTKQHITREFVQLMSSKLRAEYEAGRRAGRGYSW